MQRVGRSRRRAREQPVLAFGGEQHPPGIQVGEQADVVLPFEGAALSSIPTRRTSEKSSWARAVCTWCSTMRHTGCRARGPLASTRFIGITLAKVNTSASNSIVNPDPGRATSSIPCSGQRTRGCRACRNALC